jgi:hypothetical protein
MHPFPCPNLEYYINNRDEVLSSFDDEGKVAFLKALNSDQTNKKIKNKFYKEFDKECKEIQKHITGLEQYKHIVNSVPSNRTYNWLGSAINRILCSYENKILQEIINGVTRYGKTCCDNFDVYMNDNVCKNCNASWTADDLENRFGIEICALMFDGLMVYGDYYDDNDLLAFLENAINDKFKGLNMKLSYKEHKTGIINMPDNFEVGDKKEVQVIEKSFDVVMKEFELRHAKIINKGIFIKALDNDNVVMSEKHIVTAYKHMTYEKLDKDGNIKIHNFMKDWLQNNEMQRKYDDVDVYPKPDKCPANIFNLWRKFDMEMVDEYVEELETLEFMLNHIKILCNNDEAVYGYFIKWIAQMIQYPEKKSPCPTFISKEGAGKGSLMQLLTKMLGQDKIFQTSNPSRDVWGDFNGAMANCFLVNLDELSKKETLDSEGKIKGLITEPTLYINNKGVNKFRITSFHRFIITTNNAEPVNTAKDDRRKFIVKCSDELIGNKEYFNQFYKYLEDVNVIKTCFEYFKSIKDMDKFGDLPLPCTEYQQQLQQLSVSPIENWLKDFTYDNQDEEFVELKTESILEKFNEWKEANGVEYHCDGIKLMVRIARMKIDGIEKKPTKACNLTKFNFSLMKKHFGIGLLL